MLPADWSAAKQLRTMFLPYTAFGAGEFVHPLDHTIDNAFTIFGDRRMFVGFVVNAQVIENLFTFAVHPSQAILDNDGKFITPAGVVGTQGRNRGGHQLTVAVFMLQSFSIERCAARCTTTQEALHAGVRSTPDQVTNSLEAKH